MTGRCDFPLPRPLASAGRTSCQTEMAKALTDSLEAQFQPVNDPSEPAVIEMVNEAMCAYECAPASEPN